ncbi:hypothetical protein [Kitasatospora sp. NPDC090308]|uniref:hypothetical protein n=1 Tax=Kitasatospora sp. NPDC090308 TaxID=3364082 RepID=UPI0037F19F09
MIKKTALARWGWVGLIVAVLLAPLALLSAARAGLIGYQRPDEVVVGQSDMLGTWQDGFGMTLHLGLDHRATADGIPGTASCEREGTWMFYARSESDVFVSERSATEGQEAFASFGKSWDCEFALSVFRVHGEYVLCTVDDPDSYCTDRELLRRTTELNAPATLP